MANPFDPAELIARVQRDLERSVLRARNGIRLASGERPKVAQTPKDLVWQRDKIRLYRFRSDERRYRPPVLLVMSLVSKAYIFDLRPGSSFVEVLLGRGLDVYMLDWGIPDELESGNTLETYCDEYLPRAADAVCAESGVEELTVFGYCFGGVLALLYAAGNPGPPIRNLAVMATPIDFSKTGPMGAMVQEGRLDADDLIDETGNVPAAAMLQSFKMLKPTQDLVGYANLWEKLWNDEYVESYQTMTQWGNDQIPFPGATMRQTVQMLNRENAILNDTVRLGGRHVSLTDITCPFLSVLAEKDHITPPAAIGPLIELVGSEDRTEMRLEAGHVGIIVGRNAAKVTMPAMADWIVQHSGDNAGTAGGGEVDVRAPKAKPTRASAAKGSTAKGKGAKKGAAADTSVATAARGEQ
ncbi:MAG: alpha/beta fold hydrolase [Acidimicrobiia bacterium]|nr:alpha/beta fold hydrolase [Acidimicrobiia bacterium]